MAEITATLVKSLREQTGVGMMDAKKALVENGGDIEAAVDWLRTKGMAKAAKKAGRTAAEGLVGIVTDGTKGAVIELNSETDFVSRNDQFQTFVKDVAALALENGESGETLSAADMGGKPVSERVTDLVATIGENMALRRSAKMDVSQGAVVGYVHGALADGLGKIGVLVALESSASNDVLQGLGKQIAMHVAAANPQALDKDSVDAGALERERTVLKEQAIASGKPAEIAEKMVEGRLRKYYEEICLVEQTFIALKGFVRFQLGEGIEVEEEDFAAEVAKVANA